MSPNTIVLVVEDEVIVRMDIADFLTDSGFEILEAGRAEEAISILETNVSVGLVITDIDMPGSLDGLDLASIVRQRWPLVQIIITSGHMTVDNSQLPEGSLFIAKPYQTDQILASSRQLLA